MTFSNLPAHVEHFRTGSGLSFDRDESRRRDSRDAEVMQAAMAEARGEDHEREKVLAHLKAEDRSPAYVEAFIAAWDSGRRLTDISHAQSTGRQHGAQSAQQAHDAIKKAKEEKRGDARDGHTPDTREQTRTDSSGPPMSASERARLALQKDTREAWRRPGVRVSAGEGTRNDGSGGPRISASERARRALERDTHNAWRAPRAR